MKINEDEILLQLKLLSKHFLSCALKFSKGENAENARYKKVKQK